MQPKIGQFLYINVASVDEQEEKIVYKSRIADMDEHTIAMEIPIEESTGKFKNCLQGIVFLFSLLPKVE